MTPHPESPVRAARLLDGAVRSGLLPADPLDYGDTYIKRVHTERYLRYLKTVYLRWTQLHGATAEVNSTTTPARRLGDYPPTLAGQAGFHHGDLSSPIGEHTWTSALWSAHTAAHASHCVVEGEWAAYGLTRPPGHHAARDNAAGFCYLGNAAVAAEVLKTKFDRIAIIDVDVHHGHGTQDIFYERPDVFTVSIHVDPVRFYPFYWGQSHEVGAGEGEGKNLNMPVPLGTGVEEYMRTLTRALDQIDRFGPEAIVIALGLDAYEKDPLTGMAITTTGFQQIGAAIGGLSLPTTIVQEGGYLSNALGDNLSAFLEGFMATHNRL